MIDLIVMIDSIVMIEMWCRVGCLIVPVVSDLVVGTGGSDVGIVTTGWGVSTV